jgi:hypothetical protein
MTATVLDVMFGGETNAGGETFALACVGYNSELKKVEHQPHLSGINQALMRRQDPPHEANRGFDM